MFESVEVFLQRKSRIEMTALLLHFHLSLVGYLVVSLYKSADDANKAAMRCCVKECCCMLLLLFHLSKTAHLFFHLSLVGCILAYKSAEIVEKVVSSAHNCNVNVSYDLHSSLIKEDILDPCNFLWFSRGRAVARIESQPANCSAGHSDHTMVK